jgi:RHS repeat-associated protein
MIGKRIRGIDARSMGVLALAVLTVTAGWLSHGSSMILPRAEQADNAPSSIAARQTLLPDGRALSIDEAGQQATLSDGATRRIVKLPEVRRQGSVTVMPGGQVLLWGGMDASGNVLATGEWFDPATERFVRTGILGLPARAGHTLTVLTDGQLLMAGGWSAKGAPASDVVVWQPASHTITARTPLPDGPRFNAHAQLQPDGAIRIAGGVDTGGHVVQSTWLFQPSTQRVTRAPEQTLTRASNVPMTFPAADSTSAPIQGPLALRFATPVDVRQLTRSTITLLGPEGVVPTRVVGTEGGRLAFVQLPDDLYPGSRYTLFVKGLHTTAGAAVPYTAVGFTTAHVFPESVVMAGQGRRRSPSSVVADSAVPASDAPPLYLMAGDGKVSCSGHESDQLCRAQSFIKDGAWYPGLNNAPNLTGSHWRLYQPYQHLPDTHALEASLPKGGAALIGQVRQIDETPVANVEVSIGGNKVRTDARGVFVLKGLIPGRQDVFVDGGSASHDTVNYGRFLVGADVKAKTITHMPFVMYLPRVLPRDEIALPSPTTRETVLTHPDMPGLELHVPAGAVFKDRQGHVLTHIAIVPTPVDHAPFPLPDNFPMYFTIQPGDAVLTGLTPEAAKGMRVVYPNYGHAKPDAVGNFWVYDTQQGWRMYGGGHVTADARHVAPDKGVSLVAAMGAGVSLSNANAPSAQKPGNCAVGQPIDLQTGIMFHEWNDLSISDVMPLTLTRAYTSADTASHAFGIGGNANFSLHLFSSDGTFTEPQLVLSCGEGIVFNLVTGTSTNWPLTGDVWQHTATNSAFYGATLQFFTGTPIGEFWQMTLKDGTQYGFQSDVPNQLEWMQDRFGNQVLYNYNGGLMDQMVSPSGRSITLNYDSSNRVSSAVDNTGRTVSYTYNSAGVLSQVTYPDQTNEQYTYNAANSLLTMQDRRGTVWVTNQYDVNGRVDKQTYADGTSYQFAYTASGGSSSGGNGCGTPNQPACIISTNATKSKTVQAAAATTTGVSVIVPPGGDPTSVVSATTVTDPNGNQEQVTFDPVSHYPVTDTIGYGTSLAQTTTTAREASGLIDSVTDALGRQTTYTYDAFGNVTQVIRLAGTSDAVTTSFTYTPDYNQLASVTDPLGHTTTLGYTNGCLTSLTDALNHRTSITCNSAGQPIAVQDALSHAVTFAYQGYDLQSVTDALNRTTQFVIDALGRRVAAKDPLGNIMLTQYDVNNRVVELTDELNQSTSVSYDGNGNVLTVTLPSQAVISTTFDLRNRPLSHTDALNQTESWTYDGMSHVLSHTDRKGQATIYSYDALNRQILTTYADGSTIQPTYDAGNRLTALQDSSTGKLSWGYDGLDRATSAVTPQGTIGYTYDAQGRRTSMTPAAQTIVNYVYDDANRLTSLTQGSENVQFNYDAANRRTSLTLPNGISTVYSYDAANQLTGINYVSPTNTAMASLAYGYDLDGHRTSKTGSFVTDVLPTTTSSPGTFDLNNRETSFNGTAQSYDANGNLTSNGIDTFVWNARNQLTQITEGGNTKFSYAYDALGRRVSKSVVGAAAPTVYLYDVANAVQEVIGNVTNPILTGLSTDERFARNDVNGRTDLLTDALNSTIALTDPTGAITQQYSYDPYGNVTQSDTTTGFTNPYLYTGREADSTGLYYYRARYYSPTMGRFISEDPLGFGGGQNNFYAYVGNDPLTAIDPSGMDCVTSNGYVSCSYPGGGPAFRIPAPSNFPATLSPNDFWYHKYDVTRSIGCADPNDVMQGLINNPTPAYGNPQPATAEGTANNAAVPIVAENNPVTSYLTNDLNTGAPIVVNITGGSSAFAPGYVARTVTDGVAHTYGEGDAPSQSPLGGGLAPNWAANQYIWGGQMSQIIENAKQKCGCVH